MAVAKVIEIIAGSKISFEDAIKQGVARATDSVNDVTSVWIKDQSMVIERGNIIEYRVAMKVTFMVGPAPKDITSGKSGKKK